jgi:TonB family protein
MHPFKKHLSDQIGSAWYRYMQANSQKIALGTVRIALTASPDGKITKLRVLSNTSNQLFGKICLRAIQETKIPPVPSDLLTRGRFEDEISFTVFANPPTKST